MMDQRWYNNHSATTWGDKDHAGTIVITEPLCFSVDNIWTSSWTIWGNLGLVEVFLLRMHGYVYVKSNVYVGLWEYRETQHG